MIFESAFMKAGDSETSKGFGYQKQQENLSGAALTLWKCYRKGMSLGRAALAL